jgi:hypothetical protein
MSQLLPVEFSRDLALTPTVADFIHEARKKQESSGIQQTGIKHQNLGKFKWKSNRAWHWINQDSGW